jgi:hypothetical protein
MHRRRRLAVPSLADVQAHLADAMLTGEARPVVPQLTDGPRSAARLAIHLRHYEASLVAALTGKYPACCWLLGERFVAAAARDFVHRHPPMAPCIAEYGANFPGFLAGLDALAAMPYLRSFAELEWHLGCVSVAIDHPPLAIQALASLSGDQLADLELRMQPGLVHLHSPSPIDELMKLYLSGTAPDTFVLQPCDVWLEIAGVRGQFRIDRLGQAEFAFRRALAAGSTIGGAAELALDADAAFDPGQALGSVLAAGLAVAIN